LTRKNPNKRRRPSKEIKREAGAALVASGETVRAAAKSLGTDAASLGEWLRTECGTAALERYKQQHAAAMAPTMAESHELLRAGALASVHALLDTVRSSKGLARIKAAEAILDRVGLPKVQKIEGTVAPALDLSRLDDAELDQLTELTAKAGAM
jgi:transposase-like protein